MSMVRFDMPDGSSVILLDEYNDDDELAIIVAVQGTMDDTGNRPPPSGIRIEGESAELMATLMVVIEDCERDAILLDDDNESSN